jgi:hypothetical protein
VSDPRERAELVTGLLGPLRGMCAGQVAQDRGSDWKGPAGRVRMFLAERILEMSEPGAVSIRQPCVAASTRVGVAKVRLQAG